MMTAEYAVLQANQSFYEAYSTGDMAAMERCWSTQQPVTCIHPGWQVLRGHDRVMASWRALMAGRHSPPQSCESVHAIIIDQVAVVTCIERGSAGKLAATNIFVLEDGLWKMIHHQASHYTERTIPEGLGLSKDELN